MTNTCHAPLSHRVKAFCAFVAALSGVSLIVFAAMAFYYNSELKENEIRYSALRARLDEDAAISKKDVRDIIKRLEALETGVQELTAKEK